jgi:hypothetical protein
VYLPAGEDVQQLPPGELDGLAFPARQFVTDLSAVIDAKALMTRRQWTSLLEALVRIEAVAHVAWLCEVQGNVWQALWSALAGGVSEGIRERIHPRRRSYLRYGTGAVSELKDRTSTYIRARLGINAVLWTLEDAGVPSTGTLSSAADVVGLCGQIVANQSKLTSVVSDAEA